MMNRKKANNYILYARKSSEGEDRQEKSIHDQNIELLHRAEKDSLNVVETIFEAKSAKEPGREGFNRMLRLIDSGKADGILCWSINRLARNPIDGAQIQWRVQKSVIKHVRTFKSDHYPDDNVLPFQLELGMANQYIKDLSVDVKRGMRQKAERGWWPSTPPLGYAALNKHVRSSGEDEIIEDPELFDKVKLLHETFASGGNSIQDIQNLATRLDVKWRNSSKTIGFNTVRRLLTNPFYYGEFYWNDQNGLKKKFQGKHTPMISFSTWRKNQEILSKSRYRGEKKLGEDPKLRKCLKCKECSKFYVPDRKFHLKCTDCKTKFSALRVKKCPCCGLAIKDMDSPYTLKKTYYRCSGKKFGCGSFRFEESKLVELIIQKFKGVRLQDDFLPFWKQILPILDERFKKVKHKEQRASRKVTSDLERKKERLTNGYLAGLFDDEEFQRKRDELEKAVELNQLEQDFTTPILRNEICALAENVQSLLVHILEANEVDSQLIKRICDLTGSNLIVSKEKVQIQGFSVLEELKILDTKTADFSWRREPLELRKNARLIAENVLSDQKKEEIHSLCTLLHKSRTQSISQIDSDTPNSNSPPKAA